MATAAQWMVICDQKSWRIVQLDGKEAEPSQPTAYVNGHLGESAEEITAALEAAGYRGEPVMLALGTTRCPAVTIALPTARHGRNRQSLAYLLEPEIPWAVEEIAFDFERQGHRAFAVVCESEPLMSLIERLEERGVRVESIAPLARLALAEDLTRHPRRHPRYLLLWENDDAVEAWLIENDRPTDWQWLPADAAIVRSAVDRMQLTEAESIPVVTRNLREEIASEFDCESLGVEDKEFLTAACAEAALVLQGRKDVAMEFRRDSLAAGDRHRTIRPHLAAAQLTALLLMLAVGVALFWKTERQDSLRREWGDRQMDVYRRLFPDQRVPVGVHQRLKSELARLKGMRGTDVELPETVEAITVIQKLLSALPEKMRFRVLELRIENGEFSLVGEVRAHGDADGIATAFRKADFQVERPTTHRLQQRGVEFRVAARLDLKTKSEEPAP